MSVPPKVVQLFQSLGESVDNNIAPWITPVESVETRKWINEYLQNSHGHHQYQMELIEVYAIDRPGDSQFIVDCNHKMLWHGTPKRNVTSIIRDGYLTGQNGMFGPGIYFADCSSKSANYCHPEISMGSTRLTETLTGWMFLSEVSLGRSYDYFQAEYEAHKLCQDNNRGSVRGKGAWQPDFITQYFLKDVEPLVHVPLGLLKKLCRHSALIYNEFVIYNPKRVRHRYLLYIRFVRGNPRIQ
ncbi:Poly [ADP-ribose] polymerase [Aphelenchoides besseyi]|nr:Poly [ADP-ribose] polymerase [Aphelenchoides besseyi]